MILAAFFLSIQNEAHCWVSGQMACGIIHAMGYYLAIKRSEPLQTPQLGQTGGSVG